VLTQFQTLSFAFVHVWAVPAYYARSTSTFLTPEQQALPEPYSSIARAVAVLSAIALLVVAEAVVKIPDVAGGTLPPGMSAQKAPDIIHMLWSCNCHLPSCYESSHSLVAILEQMS
jgi:hypothetical protein